MTSYKSGEVNVAVIDNKEEFYNNKSAFSDFNLVLVNNPDDLPKYPEFVSFRRKIDTDVEGFLNGFESSKRSSIRKRIQTIDSKYKVIFTEQITQEQFAQWEKGYRNFIENKDFGEYKVPENFFGKKSKDFFGIFFYLENEMVGGALIHKLTNRLTIAFAWYGDEVRKDGGTTYVVMKVLQKCIELKLDYLSFGKDPNLFGGRIDLGLQSFKDSWGTEVFVPASAKIKGLIVNKPFEKNDLIIYLLEEDRLKKYILNNKND